MYTEIIKSDILQSFSVRWYNYVNPVQGVRFLCFMVDWDPRILRANASSMYFTITQCISCSLTYWYRKCEIKFRNNRKLSLNSSFATFLVILILPRSTYNLYHGLMIMWLNQWSNKSEFRKKIGHVCYVRLGSGVWGLAFDTNNRILERKFGQKILINDFLKQFCLNFSATGFLQAWLKSCDISRRFWLIPAQYHTFKLFVNIISLGDWGVPTLGTVKIEFEFFLIKECPNYQDETID